MKSPWERNHIAESWARYNSNWSFLFARICRFLPILINTLDWWDLEALLFNLIHFSWRSMNDDTVCYVLLLQLVRGFLYNSNCFICVRRCLALFHSGPWADSLNNFCFLVTLDRASWRLWYGSCEAGRQRPPVRNQNGYGAEGSEKIGKVRVFCVRGTHSTCATSGFSICSFKSVINNYDFLINNGWHTWCQRSWLKKYLLWISKTNHRDPPDATRLPLKVLS